jgi:RNA polymerase sigma-70 factor (ECF subfamily)
MSHFEQELGEAVEHEYDGIPMDVLQGFINDLPQKARTAFNLYVIDDIPQAEIAEMMQESQNNVRTMISRARATLRNSIQKFWKNEENR